MKWMSRAALGRIISAALFAALAAVSALASPQAALFVVDQLEYEETRATLTGVGWLFAGDAAGQVHAIRIEGGTFHALAPATRIRRPDVAHALQRPEALEAGWVFEVRLVGKPVPEGPLTLHFLDAAGSIMASAEDVPVERSAAPEGALRHRAFAVAVAFLLAVGFCLRFLVRSQSPREVEVLSIHRSEALFPAGVILACAVVLGAIVPPFQSPDEFDHVERAYFLSQGQWLLETPAGRASGGAVDRGLRAYMDHFESLPFEPEARIASADLEAAAAVEWSGTTVFSPAPGTGYYLPLLYMPQALALSFGEAAGISVDASYRLARLASGGVAALLLFAAFLRWRASVASMALLLMPMTLFQWAGAGIDALSIGASALAVALWLERRNADSMASTRRLVVVSLLVVAVVGCRIHLAPLLLLPLAMLRPWRPSRIALGLLPAAAVVAWTLLALANTHHPQTVETPVGAKLMAYAADPLGVIDVLWTTATTPAITAFYGRSFIGVLGWLDTALPNAIYVVWATMLVAAFAWSLAVADWRAAGARHAMVAAMGLLSAMLVPLLLLLMWTPFGAPVVDGVQGRYFFIPALLLAMAIPSAPVDQGVVVERFVTRLFVALVAAYGLVTLLPVLVARYFG